MGISRKNIYNQSKKDVKDMAVKTDIEKVFENNPAYGHRRLAVELKMNKEKYFGLCINTNLKLLDFGIRRSSQPNLIKPHILSIQTYLKVMPCLLTILETFGAVI